MRILVVLQGLYGRRIADNISARGPAAWTISTWQAPPVLPPVIDYPEDFLPKALPAADLVLALGEHPGVAELLPDLVQMCGVQAVIAPVDNLAWLPPGLMNQLAGWLENLGVAVVFPKPFCSLTETSYNVQRRKVDYANPLIAEFARHFGRPRFQVVYDEERSVITAVEVLRDTPCGCARSIAERLAQGAGTAADDAEQAAGLHHHHFPCLASMGIDPQYNDTLMHVSGNILKEEIAMQVKPYKRAPQYWTPQGRSE